LDGNKTPFPCGCCLCPKELLDQLASFFPFRTTKAMRQIIQDAKRMSKSKGLKHCKKFSLKFAEVLFFVLFCFVLFCFVLFCFVGQSKSNQKQKTK